jgi:hypothetical protein
MVFGSDRRQLHNDTLGLNIYAPDILAIMQSANLYIYCINNPIMWQDPSGEAIDPWMIWQGVKYGWQLCKKYGPQVWNWVSGLFSRGGGQTVQQAAPKVQQASPFIQQAAPKIQGTLGPATHSTWQAAEQATRQAYGLVKQTFHTDVGVRFVDGFNARENIIHEVKYGRQFLTDFIKPCLKNATTCAI